MSVIVYGVGFTEGLELPGFDKPVAVLERVQSLSRLAGGSPDVWLEASDHSMIRAMSISVIRPVDLGTDRTVFNPTERTV